jgi:transcriptional regulator with XRE-family HTH domain
MGHHGQTIAAYRARQGMTQEDLAEELLMHPRSVQKLESKAMVRSMQRRWFLVGLLGIPATFLDLEGTPPWDERTTLAVNQDTMSFFESELDLRWQVLNTAGYAVAANGLSLWIDKSVEFVRSASGTPWHRRACGLLSMSYQLQGTIAREGLQFDLARSAFELAYTAAKEVNDVEMMAATRVRQGQISRVDPSINDPIEATKYFQATLDLIKDKPFPKLHGNTLQALAEASAQAQEKQDAWRSIGLAERIVGREDSNERSRIKFDNSTVAAWKGVCALYLGEYDRSNRLIGKALKDYNPLWVSGRARFLMHQARALAGNGEIDESIAKAEEAAKLAGVIKNQRTVGAVRNFHQDLTQSRWQREAGIKRLGAIIAAQ